MAKQDFIDDIKSGAKDIGSRVNKFLDNLVKGNEAEGFPVAVDVIDYSSRLVFELDLPGFTKSDVNVQIRDNQLVIRGQRTRDKESGRSFKMQERAFGPFDRQFSLPTNVNQATVKAKFDNGILTVTIHKESIEDVDSSSVQID